MMYTKKYESLDATYSVTSVFTHTSYLAIMKMRTFLHFSSISNASNRGLHLFLSSLEFTCMTCV